MLLFLITMASAIKFYILLLYCYLVLGMISPL